VDDYPRFFFGNRGSGHWLLRRGHLLLTVVPMIGVHWLAGVMVRHESTSIPITHLFDSAEVAEIGGMELTLSISRGSFGGGERSRFKAIAFPEEDSQELPRWTSMETGDSLLRILICVTRRSNGTAAGRGNEHDNPLSWGPL